MIRILIEQLPVVEAGESLQAISVTSFPHLIEDDRRAMIRRLEARADYYPAAPTNPYPDAPHDPAAAARWFADQGIQVA